MPFPQHAPSPRRLQAAIAASLLLHALFLLIPQRKPEGPAADRVRMEARLVSREPAPVARPSPLPPPPLKPQTESRKPKTARAKDTAPRILTARKPSPSQIPSSESSPTWSVAEKEEMNRFLDELAPPRKPPPPSLAERSLDMAREIARERPSGGRHTEARDLLERIPDSPPVDPFSLEFYLDSLVKKLNRSAAFVKNDPRARGIQGAAVEVRINPDGSLKSFRILHSGDQAEEIAFVKSVVERAVPFASFPPDIVRSARSLGLMICIQPAGLGGNGFGFTRRAEGSGC
ncbi:hypothetical protein [Zoogloea sp.]|uniref:hypothetical protein n=1 Tax=Zoogloea sp. TaxID=49181 RepID=UPI002631FC49|nr:hypothetical protein [Zoogloea sp.]MDD3354000.1 hypothetical protein [Zoogloea sp.]